MAAMAALPPRPRRATRPGLRALGLALACALAPPLARAEPGPEALWARLREGGLVVLIRHAAAPGTYDPPGFRLGDCATQRNLSAAGRDQARRLGEALRARGVDVAAVRSSRWCRARDTAELAFGRHDPWPALDSTAGAERGDVSRRVAELGEAIAAWRGPGTLALVTHQFVISELAGRGVAEGELVVVAPRAGGFTVLGALTPAP
jgi:phosphohistidine phosphatase SixA